MPKPSLLPPCWQQEPNRNMVNSPPAAFSRPHREGIEMTPHVDSTMPRFKILRRIVFGVAALSLIGACAEQVMNSFVGKDITEAVTSYGPPVASFDLPDGRTAFQWRIDSAFVAPTTTNIYGTGNMATAYTYGGGVMSKQCFYTLFAKPNPRKSFTIVGYAPPRVGCL